jgi:hypothetical protein
MEMSFLKIDLDLTDKDEWLAIYYCLKTLAYKTAYFHLTNKGVHILIPELPDCEALRRLFGDDEMRIQMDKERELHGLESNVVFIAKCGKRYEVTNSLDRVIEWIAEVKKKLKN